VFGDLHLDEEKNCMRKVAKMGVHHFHVHYFIMFLFCRIQSL